MSQDKKEISSSNRKIKEEQAIFPEKNENTSQTSSKKKQRIIIISILIGIILVLALIIILSIVLTKKKKEKNKNINQEISITATYNSRKDIPLKIFNPSKIGLSDQNYTIQNITTSQTRILQQINPINGIIIPETTGTIEIKIIFNEFLTSLDYLFQGCNDLIKVDLSNLNSPNITSMIYTFTDCTNLEIVDFTSFSSSKVEKMEFLFGGCISLVNLKGFENLDTSSLTKTAGMFIECTNLISVNLSSFKLDTISENNGMFIENPSLEKVDLGNTTDINSIFSSTENFKVTIITTSNELNSSGLSGVFTNINREEYRQRNCTLRNWAKFVLNLSNKYSEEFLIKNNGIFYAYGHYLLYDNYASFIERANLDCNLLNNSLLSNFSNYSDCAEYKKFYINLLKEFEKCTECEEGEGNRMNCKKCNKGYYVPRSKEYSPTKCKKCEEGCAECIADNETDKSICLRCESEEDYYHGFNYDYYLRKKYILYNGKCIRNCTSGYTGSDKCKTCNDEDGKYDECLTCYDGYYLDINYSKTKCKKIDIANCSRVVLELDSIRCINCFNGYVLHNDQCVKACNVSYYGKTCSTCNQTYEFRDNCGSCNDGYYLAYNGNKAICKFCNQNIDNKCTKCELILGEVKCTECYYKYFLVEGKCVDSCSEGCLDCSYQNGTYLCNKCKEKYFLKELGEGKICKLCPEGCNFCSNDYNCTECLKGYKLINGRCHFYCRIGLFSECLTCDFNEPNKCKDCNPGYYLPNDARDKYFCYNCGTNCISCYGETNNPICTKCSNGYYLSNNTCVKQCNRGYYFQYCKECDEENPGNCGSCYDGYYLPFYSKTYCNYCGSYKIKKCHQNSDYSITIDECFSDYILLRNTCVEICDNSSYLSNCLICNEEPDKLDQCKQCKEEYYLPTNFDKTYCYKCPYRCKSCQGSYYNPVCTECKVGYILSGGKCLNNCTIGKNNLCKSCNNEPGKIDKCLECNKGYYLPENGHQQKCSKCPNNCEQCSGKYEYNADCNRCSYGNYLFQNEDNYNYYSNPTYYHTCKQCDIPGCVKYKQNSSTCICIECNTSFENQIKLDNDIISCYGGCVLGELDKCKSCSSIIGKCGDCNEGYELDSNGKCVGDFHILAKYRTTKENEYIKLMAPNSIVKMIINETIINNPRNYYIFPLPGEHLVYVKFSNFVSFMDLFYHITHLIYIEFLPKAKSFNINYMNDCFCGCTNLEYVDLSNLNLKNNKCFMNFFKDDKKLKKVKFPSEAISNIYWYYRMFYGCESLTSIDMSNIHNTNGQYFHEMFYGCVNLKIINLGGFNEIYNGYYKYNMFINVPKDAKITIHNNFYIGITDQLKDFNDTKINN